MTPEEYAAQQAAISAASVSYSYQVAKAFQRTPLTPALWLVLLTQLFTDLLHRRKLSSELGRRFYDSERERFWPDLPLNQVFLEEIDFDYFARKMEPERILMSQEDTPDHVVGSLIRRVVKEVENGGRRTIIRAVEDDTTLRDHLEALEDSLSEAKRVAAERNPQSVVEELEQLLEDPTPSTIAEKPARGWARVATGAETCAFCLAMISRGPIYLSARNAGLNLNDTEAQDRYGDGEDITEFMNQWHEGCDCKVVPVFDRNNWVGQDASKRALDQWIRATKEAEEFRSENPGRVHTHGKRKGKPYTFNEDALNALRRLIESGEINMNDYAFAA